MIMNFDPEKVLNDDVFSSVSLTMPGATGNTPLPETTLRAKRAW